MTARDEAPPHDARIETSPRPESACSRGRLALVVRRARGGEERRVLDEPVYRVGSHPSNDVVIDDPEVSRFHLRVEQTPDGWRVRDEGSLNGTWVDDVRVRDADLPNRASELRLGGTRVVLTPLPPDGDGAGRSATPEGLAPVALGELVGGSAVMRRLFRSMISTAEKDVTALIEGESGTGKDLVARELVRRSPRRDRPFVVVDCGALSPTLLESHLFGHARGAFTGATSDQAGAFEAASGGTLFFDEVGELPASAQPKLLRALEAREIVRLGEHAPRTVDVRIVAATNRHLEREVNAGRFREDLFYRLSVVTLRIPPLRERIEDLPLLVLAFLERFGYAGDRARFAERFVHELRGHAWPGNVRELRNAIERRLVLGGGDVPRGAGLGDDEPASDGIEALPSFGEAKERAVGAFEKRFLREMLERTGGNVALASRLARMDRMHLHRLLQRHGLKPGPAKSS